MTHTKLNIKETDPLILSYLAGLFDGEGSLGYHSSGTSRRFTMEVKMTDYPSIELFKNSFGGQLRMIKKKTHEHYKDQWIWRVMGDEALEVYYLMEPYLRLKNLNQTDLKATKPK